ncbi:MAG TPA: hypothetical protein VFI47_20320 [Acidimicrobiales bacterium]|nr:hypothetical protein [Acidimicrobiales bacterium]
MTVTARTQPGDDALLSELRRVAAAADPVPGDWFDAAAAAFTWSTIDAPAATLAYDTVVGRDRRLGCTQLVGLLLREMRWDAGPHAVELTVDVAADKVRVLGRLCPAAASKVTVLWPEGRRSMCAGETGEFQFDEMPRRPFCVVVDGGAPLKTGWILT